MKIGQQMGQFLDKQFLPAMMEMDEQINGWPIPSARVQAFRCARIVRLLSQALMDFPEKVTVGSIIAWQYRNRDPLAVLRAYLKEIKR